MIVVPVFVADVSPAPASPTASVVTAKSSGAAVLIWDASSVLQKAIAQHLDADHTLQAIKADAVSILVSHAPDLPNADKISLRVVYPHAPEYNPQYKVETFLSVERLMTVSASRKAIIENGPSWSRSPSNATAHGDLRIEISGSLPPAQ